MRILFPAALIAAALLSSGCKTSENAQAFQELTVPALADLQKTNAVKVYDVNTDDFRAEHGKIPGAILLASSNKYDLSLLPTDKNEKLAFYCTNRR